MKGPIEKRKASGLVDYIALVLTTFGVGYIPGAPGTYGSVVGVLIYFIVYQAVGWISDRVTSHDPMIEAYSAATTALVMVGLAGFCLIGIWASNRAIPILGNEDPSEAVVDEVMGQLVTFCFIPFHLHWELILGGFLLFRAFDIWKPFPVRALEGLPGGLGVCADDIVAGVYAGICLAIGWAIYLALWSTKF